MLYKSLEFKNVAGRKVKVVEIPVLGTNNHFYFMVQMRLQILVSSLYNKPQEKTCYSFREYLKQKIKWPDFEELFHVQEFKTNA